MRMPCAFSSCHVLVLLAESCADDVAIDLELMQHWTEDKARGDDALVFLLTQAHYMHAELLSYCALLLRLARCAQPILRAAVLRVQLARARDSRRHSRRRHSRRRHSRRRQPKHEAQTRSSTIKWICSVSNEAPAGQKSLVAARVLASPRASAWSRPRASAAFPSLNVRRAATRISITSTWANGRRVSRNSWTRPDAGNGSCPSRVGALPSLRR
jgi:hypothetical protein